MNFGLRNIGEKDKLKIGDRLSVYRDNQYIAGLEVIQVRRDIAAADIRQKVGKIQAGDIVR
mgnify:FL=1